MRASLANFGDLRNDSFSSPTAVKLMRRGSQLRTSEAGGPTPCASGRPVYRTAASGDLLRTSTSTATFIPGASLPSGRELPSPFSAATPNPGNAPPSPCRRPRSAVPADFPPDSLLDSFGGVVPVAPGGAPPQRTPSGAIGVTGRVGSVTDMPRLPHPPSQPRQPGCNASPSPVTSTDHLPPMVSPIGSIRDRPPTPRGGRTSISGIGAVLASLHLPEIMSSGKSVTERRSSMAGDTSVSRSRRNSVSGPVVGVRPSGASFLGLSGGIVQGPGGAAINASMAKRAAAAIAAGVTVPSPRGSACGTPMISPSGASSLALTRPLPLPGPSGVCSSSGKPPVTGGILQDYQSSVELEDEGGPGAADVESDRGFRQPSSGGPRPETPPSGELPIGSPRPPSVRGPMQPHAPRSERSAPQGGPRRPIPNAVPAFINPSPNPSSSGLELPASPLPPPHHPRRQSCSATMFAAPISGGASDVETVYGSSPAGERQVHMTSLDAIPQLSPPPALDAKMRLASIRLSYAEGIVGSQPESPGPAGAGFGAPVSPATGRQRASLDLPPAALAKIQSTAWPQSPGAGTRGMLPIVAAAAPSRISP